MSKSVATLGRPCGQCGKPSVVEIGGLPICVDCSYKWEVARTMSFRLNAIAMNHALDEMDNVTGMPLSGPRIQVPEIPKGLPILNNIKVDNSVVGSINTGNVRAIDVNLTYLHSAGNDKARDALKELIEAVVNETSINDTKNNAMINQIKFNR